MSYNKHDVGAKVFLISADRKGYVGIVVLIQRSGCLVISIFVVNGSIRIGRTSSYDGRYVGYRNNGRAKHAEKHAEYQYERNESFHFTYPFKCFCIQIVISCLVCA